MRIYDFGKDQGKAVERFGSERLTVTGLLGESVNTHLICMHTGRDGKVGRHDAVSQQLFMVVSGEGWVSGADGGKVPIRAGQAAFWEQGESHASGSEGGMTVMVAESEKLGLRLRETKND